MSLSDICPFVLGKHVHAWFHMGFPARYIDVSSPWSVGNISLTIRYNILLCRFEYSLEMITVIYSYPYSFDSVDHIRVVRWVLYFSLRHALPNGA